MEFRKAQGFHALAWEGKGIRGMPGGLSLGSFVLSIRSK